MCGIIGYIGTPDGITAVLDGLSKLEYRGYDSAGLAYINKSKIELIRSVGHVEQLSLKVKTLSPSNKHEICIGHTRWATHGEPTERNAHPHLSNDGRFAVVHNGIIENYKELIEVLSTQGITMHSDTDTEVIPNLIQYNYKDLKLSSHDSLSLLLDAVNQTLKHLKGSYALAIMSADNPDVIICVKHGMPLNIAKGKEFMYITSDIPTAMSKSNEIYILENDELAIVQKHQVYFMKNDREILKKPIYSTSDNQTISKLNYSTYMEKEINEIPAVFENLLTHYQKNPFSKDMLSLLKDAQTIHICACGTAYHAGLVLGALLERHCQVRTKTYIASEFRYQNPLINTRDLGIVISQSGETADTIAAMHLMKDKALSVIAFCNTDNSTIAREATYNLPTVAGFEIAVASTKAYCAQVLLAALLTDSLYTLQNSRPLFDPTEFKKLPIHAREVVSSNNIIKQYAEDYKNIARIFFIGKGMDCFTSMESALKVKEITYLQCEGYAAGELKHGTLSLVDNNTLTVIYQTDKSLYSKTANSTEEVRARGSKTLAVSCFPCLTDTKTTEAALLLPASPLVFTYSVIPAQLFALHLSLLKGHNPDKPRNLAKSVTVE